jgi:hypothetical protein
MTTRGPEHVVKPLTEKHTMSAADLAATALSPDSAMPLKVRPGWGWAAAGLGC